MRNNKYTYYLILAVAIVLVAAVAGQHAPAFFSQASWAATDEHKHGGAVDDAKHENDKHAGEVESATPACCPGCADEEVAAATNVLDPHAGHSHAKDVPDPHAGHVHAKDVPDPHAGHSHAKDVPDPHAGHSHAKDAPDPHAKDVPDPHAGHSHAKDAPDPHAKDVPDPHAGHSHAKDAPDPHAKDVPDPHAGHAHAKDATSAHAAHGSEAVHLSEAQIEKFGIEVGAVQSDRLDAYTGLTGQIMVNDDSTAHIVPRASGIVREVKKNLGDTVRKGEIMAWLESSELGKAKIEYYTKWMEVSCCAMELSRTLDIHDNTLKLLEALKISPSLDTIKQSSQEEMGNNRGEIIAAYSRFVLAKSTYLREKDLLAKSITSKNEYLAAESNYKEAEARFLSTSDSVSYDGKLALLEVKNRRRIAEFDLKMAEQNLLLLGLTQEDIQTVKKTDFISLDMSAAARQKSACKGGPNCTCTTCQSNESTNTKDAGRLAWYALRAPFDGVVIAKHITMGEKLTDDADAFAIADLSTVWLDLQIHERNLPKIRKGQKVTLHARSGMPETLCTIDYIHPIVDEKTRTALARSILPNKSRQFRPGTFITASVALEQNDAGVLVSKAAVQYLAERPVVFVRCGDSFELRDVVIGRTNGSHVEIASGLKTGELVVTRNGFRIKAELEKLSAGDVGHGHAH
jgi:membrane fusion protein, heavy metal efflux system